MPHSYQYVSIGYAYRYPGTRVPGYPGTGIYPHAYAPIPGYKSESA